MTDQVATLDVEERHLRMLLDILAEHAPDADVMAFGSRALGKAKPYSDLDLAVRCTGKMDIGKLARLEEAFQESDVPFRVDVVDWYRISDAFRAVVERTSVTIRTAV